MCHPYMYVIMRGARNFHERGSNENGNFCSQTRGGGGSDPQKITKLPFFLGKIFKFQGGGVRTPGPSPPLDPRMVMVKASREIPPISG